MLNISTYDGDVIDNESQDYGTMNSHNGSTYAGGFYYGEYHSPGKLVIESKQYMGESFAHGKLNGKGHHLRYNILFMGNF